jgi:hypothetical protein
MKCLLLNCLLAHSSITNLKNLNDDLNARIEKLSVASSSIDHVSICAKCKYHDFNACSNHAFTIAKLHDKIVHLNVQLKTCKNEVEKLNLLGIPLPLAGIPPLRMALVSKMEPRTLKAKRRPQLHKGEGEGTYG